MKGEQSFHLRLPARSYIVLKRIRNGPITMTASPTVVITADETMMSQYRGGIFLGFATCAPSGIIPSWVFFNAFAPPVPRDDGIARYCDFGLRMVEASLLSDGFKRSEVAVCHPKDLKRVVGKATKVVAIGVHDPLGINPPTSTFIDLIRTGPPYNRLKFLELLNNPALRGKKIVVGGKGAWQVAEPGVMAKLGIDHIHLGEGERSMPVMVRSLVEGREVPPVVTGEEVPVEDIPNLMGGTVHGLVECSRGCGRGCSFCTPNMWSVRHKSPEHIVRDVEVNVKAGNTCALLHSEDMFRYGTTRIEADEKAVMDLFRKVAAIEGIRAVGLSHIALATAYHHPRLVEESSELFSALPDEVYIGAQTGIETGSPALMEKYMKGKVAPSAPGKWPEIVVQSLGMLDDNNYALACTMISGLPGETTDDVLKSIDLLDDLSDLDNILVVPMNFVSMQGSRLSEEDSFTVKKMTPEHWMLLGKALEMDLRAVDFFKKTLRDGNIVTRALAGFAINRFSGGAKRYITMMKRGEAPTDFSKIRKNYLNPEL